MDMPAVGDSALEGEQRVDVHFFVVGVDRAAAEAARMEIEALLEDPWMPVPPMSNYMAIGGLIGSQQAALQLFALGEVLGFWRVFTPERLGIPLEERDEIAGRGGVLISGGYVRKVIRQGGVLLDTMDTEDRGWTVDVLVERTGFSKGDVEGALGRLVELDLVELVDVPEEIRLTPAGRETVRRRTENVDRIVAACSRPNDTQKGPG